ncbi:MAG: hypothetical protein H7Z75_10200 [Ferruginibacter sp.]|nr:hypothetical protein [Cytophagales bacterium]
MTDAKELFCDKSIRCGGFYELCIQVCLSVDTKPIETYTNHIWKLENVDGPYDNEFNKITVNIENYEHQGIIQIDKYLIPFRTFNIREQEPVETGYNWFDISFHTAAIESVFGNEYQTWIENPNPPKILQNFLLNAMKKLFNLYSFQLAFIDYEVSGQYYLGDLKNKLNYSIPVQFFIGRENFNQIAEENRNLIKIID